MGSDQRPTRRSLLGAVPLAAWIILFPLLAANQYQIFVGVLLATYALSAMGLTLVVGRAGQLALGQAAFMAIGAYSVAYSTTVWHVPFLLALAGSALVAFIFGIALGWIALRLSGNYLAMATLAFGLIIDGLLNVNSPLGGPLGFSGIPPISLFGHQLISVTSQYIFCWVIVGLAFVGCLLWVNGRAGRELSALRDDEIAASTLGIHTRHRKLQAFGMSATLGGLSGGLIAATSAVIDPSLFPPSVSFEIFLMIVIGGLGSIGGAIAGAAIVVWLIQLTPSNGNWTFTILGVVVIVVMALFPTGFSGLVTRLLEKLGSQLNRSRTRSANPARTSA